MIFSRFFLPFSLGLTLSLSPAKGDVHAILKEYCFNCHSTEKHEGELDLESSDIEKDSRLWEHVLDQIELKEMPPKKAKALPSEAELRLVSWIKAKLNEIALKNAGDPGLVVLRRLSNHEYTYTLRDLTGLETLDPAQEFPVDGAAGEGFTNVGAALVMSPSLLTKYLEAAKDVAAHAVFTPTGMRWSESTSSHDWTNEILEKIREFYNRHTGLSEGTEKVVDGVKLDTGTGGGRVDLSPYLGELQGKRSDNKLNKRYLSHLNKYLKSEINSPLAGPLRTKFTKGELQVADIQAWQQVLWKFGFVGHLAPDGGPKRWQEPVNPLVTQQEHRIKLPEAKDYKLRFITHSAGDGTEGDQVQWLNSRLEAPGRQPIPVHQLPQMMEHLQSEKLRILENTVAVLTDLQHGTKESPEDLRQLWKSYFGLDETPIQGHLVERAEKVQNHPLVRGWTGDNALSILANGSNKGELIPGLIRPHSVAMHAGTEEDAVLAWQSPTKGRLFIQGDITKAHTGCGGGASWSLEVRRGLGVEVLASGIAPAGKPLMIGPFDDVGIEVGQHVALVIKSRNKNNTCGLTAVNLEIKLGNKTWNVAKNISSNPLKGNPHGEWHFLKQAHQPRPAVDLPTAMIAWREKPSLETAQKVKEHLSKNFPIYHTLLAKSIEHYRAEASASPLTTAGNEVVEITIPAALAKGAEFVTEVQLKDPSVGSVQTEVTLDERAKASETLVVGMPILTGQDSVSQKRFEIEFDEFRDNFPISLCYTRIVPVDEGVTLSLYHREDEPLQRLLLSQAEIAELNRLWAELRLISAAPLKQFDAFEQLVQYATQIRAERAAEFEKLRGTLTQSVEAYQSDLKAFEESQTRAVLRFAEQAWRRPLTEGESIILRQFEPRMMLTRVLISPNFLYKMEEVPASTSPINDWEYASRLSYFLWSSAPDQTLRLAASSDKLQQRGLKDLLAHQMLQSPKIGRLALEFGAQWLHVRDLETLDEKSDRHFPTFVKVRESMQGEVVRFFTDLFQRDQSILTLLEADHTFVNAELAEHYGIPFEGEGWKRIDGMRALGRGGILGFAAPLAKHSGASRTSAILRGTWMSEVILGDKLPPPPRGVPVLPDEFPEGLTERELIERHTKDPNCAACHKRIDPFGFALEGFDAIGRSRVADTTTELFDGTKIDGLAELRDYIANQRRADFLEQFCRKFLGYALGRAYQLSDRPLIEQMMRSDLKPSSLISLIIHSKQFTQIRGMDAQEF